MILTKLAIHATSLQNLPVLIPTGLTINANLFKDSMFIRKMTLTRAAQREC